VTADGEPDLPSIGAPARRALEAAGVTTLAQVATWTAADLGDLHGVGPRAVRLLREAMAERSITFTDDRPG